MVLFSHFGTGGERHGFTGRLRRKQDKIPYNKKVRYFKYASAAKCAEQVVEGTSRRKLKRRISVQGQRDSVTIELWMR